MTVKEPLPKQQVGSIAFRMLNVESALFGSALCPRQLVRPRKTGILLPASQRSANIP